MFATAQYSRIAIFLDDKTFLNNVKKGCVCVYEFFDECI